MHRVEAQGATVDNKFTKGDPSGGVQATVVSDDWLNSVQEELCTVIEAAGIAVEDLAGDTQDQLLAAIAALRTSAFTGSNQSLSGAGYQKLPGGLIIQWGSQASVASGTSAVVTLPIAATTSVLQVVSIAQAAYNGTTPIVAAWSSVGPSSFTLRNISTTNSAFSWLAITH